jgi:magnesium chelatase subunit D
VSAVGEPADRPWADALAAAALLAVDPAGLGGAALRGFPGPLRDRWLAELRTLLPPDAPWRRAPLQIGDDRLLGGLDLTATLAAGRPVRERGLLAEADGGIVVLAMAERLPAATAARLAAVLDTGEVRLERDGMTATSAARLAMVALDEGVAEDEVPPAALLERLAFRIDLGAIAQRNPGPGRHGPEQVAVARACLPAVLAGKSVLEALCATATVLGVGSIRAPLLALRAARAAAALAGRDLVGEEDAALAGRLVLAPRATMLPGPEDVAPEPAETPSPPEDQGQGQGPLDEIVLAAAQAAIPEGLLARLRAGLGLRQAKAGRSAGQTGPGTGRGRPAGTRPGLPQGGAGLDLVATLRAAAPWQRLRQSPARIAIRASDLRVIRRVQRTRTTTIFLVDASGSAAFHRLAEAKGAVEMLLAECYVRRDQVALLAFRGRGAELLLPPTRSLTRTRRSLADLPGGGGTPLAAGIGAALALADAVRRKGETPALVLLTDGRANVARDGMAARVRAEEEALAAAAAVRGAGLNALLVDTSPKPQPQARRLAQELGALYLPLPHADAAALSTAARQAAAVR